MSTATTAERATASHQPQAAHTPPPLRLPKFLLEHLSRPLNTSDDVDVLVAQLRMAEWRGLL